MLGVMTGIILLRLERESRFVRFHALQSILSTAIAVVKLIVVFLAGLHTISYAPLLGLVSVWFYVMCRAAAATTTGCRSLVGGPNVMRNQQVDHAVLGVQTVDREWDRCYIVRARAITNHSPITIKASESIGVEVGVRDPRSRHR